MEASISLTEKILKSNFKKYECTRAVLLRQFASLVWQNGEFGAKFNGSSSIDFLYKTEQQPL